MVMVGLMITATPISEVHALLAMPGVPGSKERQRPTRQGQKDYAQSPGPIQG